MANIFDLSPEVLLQIAGLLPSPDLRRLAVVCHTLQVTAESILYEELTWSHKTSAAAPIDQLLLNLLRQPKRRPRCRKLSFTTLGQNRASEDSVLQSSTTFSSEETSLVTGLIDDARLPQRHIWLKRFQDREVDAVVALILLLLPNVQEVNLDDEGRVWENDETTEKSPVSLVIQHMVSTDAKMSPGLSRLAKLTSLTWTSDFATGLLAFNREKKVSPDKEDGDGLTPQPPAIFSQLRHMHLRKIRFSEPDLVDLLTPFTKLERLNLDIYRGDHTLKFEGPLLRKGLLPSRDSLEDLVITIGSFDGTSFDNDGPCPYEGLGSLSDFTSLKSIEMAMDTLISYEAVSEVGSLHKAIPPNLEVLKIRQHHIVHLMWLEGDVDERCLPELETFLQDWKTHTPRLRHVKVGLHTAEYLDEDDVVDIESDEVQALMKYGVDFEACYQYESEIQGS